MIVVVPSYQMSIVFQLLKDRYHVGWWRTHDRVSSRIVQMPEMVLCSFLSLDIHLIHFYVQIKKCYSFYYFFMLLFFYCFGDRPRLGQVMLHWSLSFCNLDLFSARLTYYDYCIFSFFPPTCFLFDRRSCARDSGVKLKLFQLVGPTN